MKTKSLLISALSLSIMTASSPALAALAGPVKQGETLTVLSGSARVIFDANADQQKALVMITNAKAVGPVVANYAASKVVLRVRGDFAGTSTDYAPRGVLLIDGQVVKHFVVNSKTWINLSFAGAWKTGTHNVEVRYINDAVFPSSARNLRLDRVTFGKSTPPAPASLSSSMGVPTGTNNAYETRLLQLVNGERSKAGLRNVSAAACANKFARDWSAHMLAAGSFEHRSQQQVMDGCQQSGLFLSRAGENIAYGNVSADQMMTMWMNSTGHRANILNPSYTHMGNGTATSSGGRVYGTQNFLSYQVS